MWNHSRNSDLPPRPSAKSRAKTTGPIKRGLVATMVERLETKQQKKRSSQVIDFWQPHKVDGELSCFLAKIGNILFAVIRHNSGFVELSWDNSLFVVYFFSQNKTDKRERSSSLQARINFRPKNLRTLLDF